MEGGGSGRLQRRWLRGSVVSEPDYQPGGGMVSKGQHVPGRHYALADTSTRMADRRPSVTGHVPLCPIFPPSARSCIALLRTYLNRMNAFHYNILASDLFQGNLALQQRLQILTGGFVAKGYDLATAKTMALQAIRYIVEKQSSTMSYNDAFLLIGIFWVVSPTIFLLHNKKAAAAEMAH